MLVSMPPPGWKGKEISGLFLEGDMSRMPPPLKFNSCKGEESSGLPLEGDMSRVPLPLKFNSCKDEEISGGFSSTGEKLELFKILDD